MLETLCAERVYSTLLLRKREPPRWTRRLQAGGLSRFLMYLPRMQFYT